MNSSVGCASTDTAVRACGVSASTATPVLVATGVSTDTEYSPGAKTSRGTDALGSSSTPSAETCRVSSSKPFTSNCREPSTVRSTRASGLCAKRQAGAMPIRPFDSTWNVVAPRCGPAE